MYPSDGNPKSIIDYLSDEIEALQEDDDEPSTLEDLSKDSDESDGSLKEFVVSEEEDVEDEGSSSPLDSDELEMYDNPRKRRRLTAAQIARIRQKKKKMRERMELDEKEAINTTNIILGTRRRRKPVDPIYKPDNLYREMMMDGVDLEYFEETEERDLQNAEDDDDDEYVVESDDDSDEDYEDDETETTETESMATPKKRPTTRSRR
jgi:hypothetical protein